MQSGKGRGRMRHTTMILVAAFAVLFCPGIPPLADTVSKAARDAFEKRFEEMDTNLDGKIDRTEYVDYEVRKANERFDVADDNGDGFITKKEAERAMKKNQEEMRKKMQKWREKKEKEKQKP